MLTFKSDIFSLGATLYEICLGRAQTLPENGPEWQNMRQGILLQMPNTNFELQLIIREMMAPHWRSRPSAEKLLSRRQLLSDEQRELIVERNKATAANLALDVQMVRDVVERCFVRFFIMKMKLDLTPFSNASYSNVSRPYLLKIAENSIAVIPSADVCRTLSPLLKGYANIGNLMNRMHSITLSINQYVISITF